MPASDGTGIRCNRSVIYLLQCSMNCEIGQGRYDSLTATRGKRLKCPN